MGKKKLPQLREFKVTLHRVRPGERAVDPADRKNIGQRTKLGGEPNWIQNDDTLACPDCNEQMTFVAQIDSVEHISLRNPFGMDFADRDQTKLGWSFSDAGMIYVFYCFNCGQTRSVHQDY